MRHGGDLSDAIATYGGSLDSWLDVSTGINPHAYPFADTLHRSDWTRLPGTDDLDRLIRAARLTYSVPKGLAVAAAPGTQVLISLLPECMPLGGLHILGPTYSSHAHAWTRTGRGVKEWNNLEEMVRHLKTDPGHVLLVNPNNPDARRFKPAALLALAEVLKATGHHLIVDEAFADCVPDVSLLPHLKRQPNVLVLRSFGKFYGLAGLRLGFLIGPEKTCGALSLKLDSWAVSGPALALGTKALCDAEWRQSMNRQLNREMEALLEVLQSHGLEVVGHTPLYCLVRHPQATALHGFLAKQQIWSRRFDYEQTWLRFGIPGSSAGLQRLSHALTRFGERG